jgi:hypothetical protein
MEKYLYEMLNDDGDCMLIAIGYNDYIYYNENYLKKLKKKQKKIVRRNCCFETNSSSMHSICITKNDVHVTPEELTADYNSDAYNEYEFIYLWKNKLNMHGVDDGFGRYPFEILYTFRDKLKYAMCEYLGNMYIDDPEWEEIYGKFCEICAEMIPGFEDFYIYTREENIYLDDKGHEIQRKNLRYDHYDAEHNFFVYTYKDEEGNTKIATLDEENYMEQPDIGFIDHQSAGLLKNFLKDKGISLKEFLTNKKYVIIIDGDEYEAWNRYKKTGIIDKSFIVEEFDRTNDRIRYEEWKKQYEESSE